MRIDRANMEAAFDAFGKYLVQQSRTNLSKRKRIDRKGLYDSLGYEFKRHPNSFMFAFTMAEYGKFVDKGVQGVSQSKKAPKSPYKFGSGNGPKGGFRPAIDGWVKRKGILFRDRTTGRMMSREQTSFLIRNSIWHTGLETTNFFSRPFELAFKRLPGEIIEAYGLDVEKWLKQNIK